MAYNSLATISIHGRLLGLQRIPTPGNSYSPATPGQVGNSKPQEYLVGPDDLRRQVTTAETSGVNLQAHGISYLPGTSAGSSTVYTIDPPVPGVRKTIWGSSIGAYLKLANQSIEGIVTTAGSTFTVVKSTAQGGLELLGLTTGLWLAVGYATGFTFSTTT